MEIISQIRHSLVHNVGVLTQSDATKLGIMLRRKVPAPCLLTPTGDDVYYLKRYLDDLANRCNQRVGTQLAKLLATIHRDNPSLFQAQDKANRLAAVFEMPLTIDGRSGSP